MNTKGLHIIAFNVPYPPDYGGVIDVYHKIRWLKKMNVRIILHTFTYGRPEAIQLEELCDKVYYYKRDESPGRHISLKPYIINSRKSSVLLNNLNSDPYPVLFEGLHTTFYLGDDSLKSKFKMVRTHNIEHTYYFKLAKAEKSVYKKAFFFLEGIRLNFAEKRLKKADRILSISKADQKHFNDNFGNSSLINPFHSNDEITVIPGKGNYILFHGNLSVPENALAAKHLIENVFCKIDFPIIIAGKDPTTELIETARKYDNIQIQASPSESEMNILIREAQANVLFTFQQTGIKLKFIESLFKGRFCIVNDLMAIETGLEDGCITVNSAGEFIGTIQNIMNEEFTQEMVQERKKILSPFQNEVNANKIVDILANKF